MSARFAVNDQVYIPIGRISPAADTPYAMARGTVTAVAMRTLTVDLPYGIGLVNVATSLAHADVGVCIIRVGDLRSEDTLLNPLSKSVLQYFRLLIPDDQLKHVALRTKEELYQVYADNAPSFTHFVLIGHGGDGGLVLSCGQRESASELAAGLEARCAQPRMFISLCCHTGKASFGRPFSQNGCCASLIAPSRELHGAVASQFLQTFFGYHFLEGRTFRVAFKKARQSVPGSGAFRIWKNGEYEGRPS